MIIGKRKAWRIWIYISPDLIKKGNNIHWSSHNKTKNSEPVRIVYWIYCKSKEYFPWWPLLGLPSWYPIMCWGHCPCTPSCSQICTTHLKIRHPSMKSTGARSSNRLQSLNLMIGHQESSSSNNHQGDRPYWDDTPGRNLYAQLIHSKSSKNEQCFFGVECRIWKISFSFVNDLWIGWCGWFNRYKYMC